MLHITAPTGMLGVEVDLPGLFIRFFCFFYCGKKAILKGNKFFVYIKYWSSDSTHFAHLSGKL